MTALAFALAAGAGQLLGIVELVLVFGIVVGFAWRELHVTAKARRRSEAEDEKNVPPQD